MDVYKIAKMPDSTFVTIDIESPEIVSSENESVHVPFFKSILMRKILLITAVLSFLVLLAILIAFAVTR